MSHLNTTERVVVISLIQQLPTCVSKNCFKNKVCISFFLLHSVVSPSHLLPSLWPNLSILLSQWPTTHTRPLSALCLTLRQAPPLTSTCSSAPIMWRRVVGRRFYDQRGACLPRSPPTRTTRHQTPPPLPPKPEWVPPCVSSHTRASSYLLSPHASPILHPFTQDQHPGFLEPWKSMWKIFRIFLCFFPFDKDRWANKISVFPLNDSVFIPSENKRRSRTTNLTLSNVGSPQKPVCQAWMLFENDNCKVETQFLLGFLLMKWFWLFLIAKPSHFFTMKKNFPHT